MKDSVITVKGISKSYKISHELKASAGNVSFRDAIIGTLKKPIELLTGHVMKKEEFWALKDVNFNVERGDAVGIIGKNGSGKSTLLKVMSRITEPTKGKIVMNGRVASLLEVGTGFHPELSGRENVYFNGSILGMKKKEIDAKFDEIVEFSGVEKFLDTPVKFYSSGMYVRLAFAVAAHLEPDILIVDEVLAVGDADFQRKSLGKMRDVTQNNNRTVIFVSHNMDAVKNICNKCVWINEGKVMAFGETDKVVEKYLKASAARASVPLNKRKDRTGTGNALLESIKVESTVEKNREINIKLLINNKTNKKINSFLLSLGIRDESENSLVNMTNVIKDQLLDLNKGKNVIYLKISSVNLVPGKYYVSTYISSDVHSSELYDAVENVTSFEIDEYDYYNVGKIPNIRGREIFLDFDYNKEN